MDLLTPAERRVLNLAVREGLSNAAIAAQLAVSESTVKCHLRAIREKLDGSGSSYRWMCKIAYVLGRSEQPCR